MQLAGTGSNDVCKVSGVKLALSMQLNLSCVAEELFSKCVSSSIFLLKEVNVAVPSCKSH